MNIWPAGGRRMKDKDTNKAKGAMKGQKGRSWGATQRPQSSVFSYDEETTEEKWYPGESAQVTI